MIMNLLVLINLIFCVNGSERWSMGENIKDLNVINEDENSTINYNLANILSFLNDEKPKFEWKPFYYVKMQDNLNVEVLNQSKIGAEILTRNLKKADFYFF